MPDLKASQLAANGLSTLAAIPNTYQPPAGIMTSIALKLQQTVSVFDFMTPAQIADVTARTLTLDVTAALQSALNVVNATTGTVFFPPGTYKTSAALTFSKVVTLQGSGGSSTFIQNSGTTTDIIDIGDGVINPRYCTIRD